MLQKMLSKTISKTDLEKLKHDLEKFYWDGKFDSRDKGVIFQFSFAELKCNHTILLSKNKFIYWISDLSHFKLNCSFPYNI